MLGERQNFGIIMEVFDLKKKEVIHHRIEDVMRIFNECFEEPYNTRLVRGGEEPIYLPASHERQFHEIRFAHGFFSSALHECSHWFIAGKERRKLEDFGYWYCPDGRSQERQQRFEQVEVKPQAIEWILSVACNLRFKISIDNLNGASHCEQDFKQAIHAQVNQYLENGLPPRAKVFHDALASFYQQAFDRTLEEFVLEAV